MELKRVEGRSNDAGPPPKNKTTTNKNTHTYNNNKRTTLCFRICGEKSNPLLLYRGRTGRDATR